MSWGCRANYSNTGPQWRASRCVVEPQRLHKHLLRGPASCLMKHRRGPANAHREAQHNLTDSVTGAMPIMFSAKAHQPLSLPPSSAPIPHLLLPAQT